MTYWKNDCIFSTSKTINKDNALLNCRINGLNNLKPDLFIIDLNLKLKKDLSIINIARKRKIFLITIRDNAKKVNFFKKKGFKIILVNSLSSKKDFKKMLKEEEIIFKFIKTKIVKLG